MIFPDGHQADGLSLDQMKLLIRQSYSPADKAPTLNGRTFKNGIITYLAQDVIFTLDQLTALNTDHIAVGKILQGMKDRVEGCIEPMAVQIMEFSVYVVATVIFFVALILILIRPLTGRGWIVGLAAGATWLIIWYSPVSIWTGVLLELLVLWGLIWGLAKPNAQEKPVQHEARRKELNSDETLSRQQPTRCGVFGLTCAIIVMIGVFIYYLDIIQRRKKIDNRAQCSK